MPLASAAQSDWSIVDSPNSVETQPDNLFVHGVTCVSASDCWAVGGTYNFGGFDQTLTKHWDGTAWTLVPSPNTSYVHYNYLVDVTCVSASECWAVGDDWLDATKPRSLIERWDGRAWAIVSSPMDEIHTNTRSRLYGVTCASASDCWTVGFYENPINGAYQTLIQHWDGSLWTIVNSPNNLASLVDYLYGVTCASVSDCWAVGYGSYGNGTLIEHWNGTSWAIVSPPNPVPGLLTGVTCTSPSDCWAVGYSDVPVNNGPIQTLIEHWNGTLWTPVISPNTSPTQNNYLSGVTCTSASDCWAVGYYFNGSAYQTLIERWDGTSWAIFASPNTSTTQHNILQAVTCMSASDCWAAGETLTEHWDGTMWVIDTSPLKASVARNNGLFSVSCVSASDCWAAGYYASLSPGKVQTLIEHWDGTTWAIVTSPNTSTTALNYLNGIACASASDCWAVGYYQLGGPPFSVQTLIEHWDGNAWAIVSSPNTSPAEPNLLQAVTCSSAADCWAVGQYDAGNATTGDFQTLTERWDGTAWTIINSPNASATEPNYLNSITCSSAADCWAVGYYITAGTFQTQTLIERWNGSAWAIVSSPNTSPTQINQLNSATCAAPSDCWAVGHYGGSGGDRPLIERWDGTAWTIVTSPNNGTQSYLYSVTCSSASSCWAVGYYYPADNADQTLIEHWDGTAWAIVSSPNTSTTQQNILYGVTCASESDCWAVGYYYYFNGYYNVAADQTLIEHYTVPPIPTSVVSRKTHGAAGDFDVDLPLAGNPGIECRTGGSTNDYQVIVTFPNAVTFNNAAVSSGSGSVASTSGSGTTTITLNLTGVTNAQTITITLFGANDGTHTNDVSVKMSVLIGDVSANGLVNSTDISQVQAQSGQVVTGSNFRTDVTVNGLINSTDVSIVQSKSGTGLP